MKSAGADSITPRVVLDTNAVLDCWVFRDSHAAMLAVAIESGAVLWQVCPRMRDELERALTYPQLARWSPDSAQVLGLYDRLSASHAAPPPAPAPLCRDPDDQVFFDLAVAVRARWLISHDLALHRLARYGRAFGVQIVKPVDWRLP